MTLRPITFAVATVLASAFLAAAPDAHAQDAEVPAAAIRGVVEDILQAAGFELTPVADGHLCCGSAGTYSILQPEISLKLRTNKLNCLQAGAPAAIASANIGCIAHLQGGTATPVAHWIELLDRRLGE